MNGDGPMAGRGAPDQRTLEVLLDKQEIHELHCRYCRGIDRLDPDLVRSVFHEDAVEHHPPWFIGNAHDYVGSFVKEATGRLRGPWFHMFANELVEVHGDVAYSEIYLLNINRYELDGVDFLLAGRYIERLERRNGSWKISWRARLHDLTRVDPTPATWIDSWPPVGADALGARSSADLSNRIPGPPGSPDHRLP